MGNTGYEYGGVFSPSEIDLTFYYDEGQHEIGEAFVLNDNTSKAVFKDHMGKIMGNNTRHEPLSFMLVFGNLYKSLESTFKQVCEKKKIDSKYKNLSIMKNKILDKIYSR